MFKKEYSHKQNDSNTLKLGKNTRKLYFCAILYIFYKVVTSVEPLSQGDTNASTWGDWQIVNYLDIKSSYQHFIQ